MNLNKRLRSQAEVPTSSMADIAFLLIVFFMLTAVFATTEGLQFQFPEDDPTQLDIQPEESIHIKILGQNDYVVDRSPMTDVELNNYIRAKLPQNPEKPVIIQTKAEVPYFAMVDVFDLLKYLKVRNISIPTKTEVERWEAFGIFE
ncbi:MAG: biopolymer transporter ExbD [Acidobacteriota bacterium]|nr:biopolymer transporter ExbD [Acidobacteriota bacterium]